MIMSYGFTHKTHVTEHMTVHEFERALSEAEPGVAFVYATGRLSESIQKGGPDEVQLTLVARNALALFLDKRVCLTQERVGKLPTNPLECGIFNYRCTKRTKL